jgi:hypothetical protein
VQAGLVGGGGEVVNEVAEGQFDLAEGLLFGEVNELLGHVTERLFSMGPQFVD